MTGDGTHTYQWNAEGRLKSVDNGNTATYVYNALGWRVEKKVGSAYTEVLYDQSGESLGENNRSGWTQSYVNFARRHLAIYANNSTYFPHANSLGSTVMVSDYTGAIVEDKLGLFSSGPRAARWPWGQDWQAAGTLYEERFAKLQHRDSETSLDPTPNRMFSSVEGRWLSTDPLFGNTSNPQSLNLYPYVINNPTNRTDPKGLCGCDPLFGCDPFSGCDCGCDPFFDPFCDFGLGGFFPPVPPLALGGGGGAGGLPVEVKYACTLRRIAAKLAPLKRVLAVDFDVGYGYGQHPFMNVNSCYLVRHKLLLLAGAESVPSVTLSRVTGYHRSHRGRQRRPIIRSITHAPDQTDLRPRPLHWLLDLAAPGRCYLNSE